MRYPPIVFLGGYTKSGTTFLGRVLEAFEGVYSRGEMDYLRIFASSLANMYADFNSNIEIVNEEVYDGQGALKPIPAERQMAMQRALFFDLFFNGEPIPNDCRVVIEKSPRNLFNYPAAKELSVPINYINIYRPVMPVYKSLIRHLADHRSEEYHDPESEPRQTTLERFVTRWNRHVDILEYLSGKALLVQYEAITADLGGFLDFAATRIFQDQLRRIKDPEDLTKEAYLASLPPEKRAKSLVQTATTHIELSAFEKQRLENDCKAPNIVFDF